MSESLIDGYLKAKNLVAARFFEDIAWAEDLALVRPTANYIACEHAWVVVNSGFRYQVARKLWPALREAFNRFRPAAMTEACRGPALRVLNHEGKIGAILEMATIVRERGAARRIVADAQDPLRLRKYPWIGKITCYHFAKVLGVDCVKPDVHLVRAARAAGFDTPLELCRAISQICGDRLTVIDSVLWRYGEQMQGARWSPWEDLFRN